MTFAGNRLAPFVAAVLAALALAACGSASQDADGAQALQAPGDEAAVPAAQSSVVEAPSPSEPSDVLAVASEQQSPSSAGSSAPFAQKVELGPEVEFAGIASWINSEPLTLRELKGNVVLVDVWTYTCINCIRTLPYVKEWHAKYADQGLVVVGIHSPEFEFEKERAGVVDAAKRFGLEYPIAQDNDFATWDAFDNAYWPTKYLIDRQGVIRYTHIGEGAYEQTERMIQRLLDEPGA